MNSAPANIEDVARLLLGEPNKELSNAKKLRYGSHGSLAVDLESNVFFDHETNEGGGVLDLVERLTGYQNGAAYEFLQQNGLAYERTEPDRPRISATYRYEDETGTHLYDVVRMVPKTFRQRAANGNWSVKGIRPVLYQLPVIHKAAAGTIVYVVEGEKDADRLICDGVIATTCPGGAGKWRETFNDSLRGKRVRILPDNDEAGEAHAAKVLNSLNAKGIEAEIVRLPNLPPKRWLATACGST